MAKSIKVRAATRVPADASVAPRGVRDQLGSLGLGGRLSRLSQRGEELRVGGSGVSGLLVLALAAGAVLAPQTTLPGLTRVRSHGVGSFSRASAINQLFRGGRPAGRRRPTGWR